MYIELSCGNCGDSSPVSFACLYDIWKEGYKKIPKGSRSPIKATTTLTCSCGHTDTYDGPMFRYIFQLIFDELILEKEI